MRQVKQNLWARETTEVVVHSRVGTRAASGLGVLAEIRDWQAAPRRRMTQTGSALLL